MENSIKCREIKTGISLKFRGRSFKLTYPKEIWKSYPNEIKGVLIDNLAHLLTINLPIIADIGNLKYNTPPPFFRFLFYSMVVIGIPSAVESYRIPTDKALKRFMRINYEFKNLDVKIPSFEQTTERRAIVPFSFGKDSLLTLAVCKEIGLDPVPVYINDTVSPKENRLKIITSRKLFKEFGIKTEHVKNEIEQLNDFEFFGKPETCLGYTHMVTGFCFISLPFANHYKAKYIVIGNQQDMNFSFVNKDGFLTIPSPDQSHMWMMQQDNVTRLMTNDSVRVTSVIQPLTNIAIMKVLHNRYGEYGKYQISCDCLDPSDEERWCHACVKCARLFLFMKANGIDVKRVGFKTDLFQEKYRDLFSLFNGKETDNYEKSEEAKEQQLLAFYMALKNGEKGDLIEKFKEAFLDEAKRREDELHKKFFSIHDVSSIPAEIRDDVVRVYKEELSK